MDLVFLRGLSETAGIVGALAIIALIYVWREWRKEHAAHLALWREYVENHVEIIGDYHEFAHTLDRISDILEEEVAEERTGGSVAEGPRST